MDSQLTILVLLTFLGLSAFTFIEVEANLSKHTFINEKAESGKTYDEMACIVDNKAGIRCFQSVGKTCKRERDCTPVEAISAENFFTAQELAAWPNVDLDNNYAFKYYMYVIGWFVHPDEDF